MTRPKTVYFLGAKPVGYACLEYLLAEKKALGIEVAGVVTRETPQFDGRLSVVRLSSDNGIPVHTSADSLVELEDADFLVSVQHHEILKKQHIAKARELAVNLHMAPLPEYRGCNQFSFAIVNGDAEFGTTIHRLEEGIDSGDIICERRFPIPENCFVSELYELTKQHSIEMFRAEVGQIICGRAAFTPQQSLLGQRECSYHFRKDIEQLKEIDLAWPRERIERHIRATLMPGFPPPYASIGGRKVEFVLDEPV